jgi:parvulin-like peptidyl-prolyl isomerase
MSSRWVISILVFTVMVGAHVAASGAAPELPTVKGKRVVASVAGETITLDELREQVGSPTTAQPSNSTADRKKELAVLGRMINVLLIAQEAKRMGLDQLPETRTIMDAQARIMLREELVERTVKDLKADPKLVEEAYQTAVREWKVSAILFETEDAAKAMAADLAAGKPFADLAKDYLASGRAAKVESGVALQRQAMEPAIVTAVTGMAVGATSAIIKTGSGFVLVRLDEIVYPDDPAARRAAEETALGKQRQDAVRALDAALRKKYARVHEALLQSLDYDAPRPGLEAFLKDQRALAEIKGEKPLTVAELSEELRFEFFHGTKMAAERGRINERKAKALDALLHRKLFRKEAMRLGLHKTDSYRRRVRAYEASLLFEAALRKVVAPTVKLEDGEVKAYYEQHRSDYTSPEMMRIRSLAFSDTKRAERALESLLKGAEFDWVAGRAEGQVTPGTKGMLVFDGRPIMTSELPEGVRKAVTGARSGDARLYAGANRDVYVLWIEHVISPAPRPFEDVKAEIAKTIAAQKIEKAVEDYAAKLRSMSEVKIHLAAP